MVDPRTNGQAPGELSSSRMIIGDWEIDWDTGELVRGEERSRLEPKSADLLRLFVTNLGSITSKEQILDSMWPNEFVGEDVVWRHVHAVRKALRDDAQSPRYIENIPRRGYRLIASVAPVGEAKGVTSARVPRIRHAVFASAGVVVVVAAAAGWPTPPSPPAETYRAALHESAETHYAGGDEANLTRAEAVYGRLIEEWPDDARARAGRATVRVMQIDRHFADAEFAERSLLEAKLAVELDPTLPEAYNALALAHAVQGDFPASIQALEKAVHLRPHWPRALNNLAAAYIAVARFEDAVDVLDNALGPGIQAAAAATNLGYAHYHLGNLQEAARRVDEGLGLNALLPEGLVLKAQIELLQGRDEAALRGLENALGLLPHSVRILSMAATIAHAVGRTDEALAYSTRATELDPHRLYATGWARHAALLWAANEASAPDLARSLLDDLPGRGGDHSAWAPATDLALLHLLLGDVETARTLLREAAYVDWRMVRLDPAFAALIDAPD